MIQQSFQTRCPVPEITCLSLRSKWAAGKAVRAGLAVGGRIPPHFYTVARNPVQQEHKNGAGRNRRATQPPAHFHRNPVGRGELAVFPRCSLLTSRSIFVPAAEAYRSSRRTKMGRDARRPRLEKQPTDLRRKTCYFGDRTLG
jgi:hypothetical protein